MSPTTLQFDVSEAVPIPGEHHVTAWVFPPSTLPERVPVLFCIPGGTYTKAYWHLEVPGRAGYSFGEHLAAKGMLVIAVDNLATGESSPHHRAIDLTPDVVAAANACALAHAVARAASGSLVSELPPLALGPTVGVGHSMGAMLTIFQQSMHRSFDAIAPLGYGTVGSIGTFGDANAPTLESVFDAARQGLLDDLPPPDRLPLRHHFYWDDVPADVVAADDLTATTIPGVCGIMSVVPFVVSDDAGRVDCPVFIGLGERDSTRDHRDEPSGYSSSSDITLFILPTSAHCHNTAGTRHQMWDRLARWISALDA